MRFQGGQRSRKTLKSTKETLGSLLRRYVYLAARGFAQVQFSRGSPWKIRPSAHNATCRKRAVLAKGTAPSARDSSTSASVLTGSIIVPIAGKPATFPWLTAVATEPNNLHLFIDSDARLAAAAGGLARYLAEVAGLENDAVARLQSAVVAACNEAFRHLTVLHPHLEVTFVRLPDRLEIALSHQGDAGTPAQRPTMAAPAASRKESSRAAEFAGVDQIQYETRGSETVTRLTKYFGKVAPKI